jgi:uncharacterized RDD family membrane protein YckC
VASFEPGYLAEIPEPAPTAYANFFVRLFAFLIDGFLATAVAGLVYLVVAVLGSMLSLAGLRLGSGGGFVGGLMFWVLGVPVSVMAYVLYFVKQETGSAQATLGKKILGIRITDLEGRTITTGQSLGRLAVRTLLSGFIFGLGFFMAAFTARKQALHDLVAGTIVTIG